MGPSRSTNWAFLHLNSRNRIPPAHQHPIATIDSNPEKNDPYKQPVDKLIMILAYNHLPWTFHSPATFPGCFPEFQRDLRVLVSPNHHTAPRPISKVRRNLKQAMPRLWSNLPPIFYPVPSISFCDMTTDIPKTKLQSSQRQPSSIP